MERPALPHIEEVAAPELRLAGDRIDPRNDNRSREASFKGLRLRSVDTVVELRIETPEKARIGAAWWSPDSRQIAFTVVGDDAVKLWLADVKSGAAHPLTDARLNGASGPPCAEPPPPRRRRRAGRSSRSPRASPLPTGPTRTS